VGSMQDFVYQCSLTVVDVGDDRYISNFHNVLLFGGLWPSVPQGPI
jgi:hypothetical protein